MERRCSAARGLILATTVCKQTGFEPSDTCIAATFTAANASIIVAAMCDEAHAVADKPCKVPPESSMWQLQQKQQRNDLPLAISHDRKPKAKEKPHLASLWEN